MTHQNLPTGEAEPSYLHTKLRATNHHINNINFGCVKTSHHDISLQQALVRLVIKEGINHPMAQGCKCASDYHDCGRDASVPQTVLSWRKLVLYNRY